MRGKVFINYRKSLSLEQAQLLHAYLSKHLPKRRLYLDVHGLKPGSDWIVELEQAVEGSAVMLVLLPEGWLDVRNDAGQRRIDDPDDFVRYEITLALRRRIELIPVFLDVDAPPSPTALPPSLWSLSTAQGAPFRRSSYAQDAQTLAQVIKERLKIAAGARGGGSSLRSAAAALLALGVGLAAGSQAWRIPGLERLAGGDAALHSALEDARAALAAVENAQEAAEAARNAAQTDLETARSELDAARADAAEARAALETAASDTAAKTPSGAAADAVPELKETLVAANEADQAAQTAEAEEHVSELGAGLRDDETRRVDPGRAEDDPNAPSAEAADADIDAPHRRLAGFETQLAAAFDEAEAGLEAEAASPPVEAAARLGLTAAYEDAEASEAAILAAGPAPETALPQETPAEEAVASAPSETPEHGFNEAPPPDESGGAGGRLARAYLRVETTSGRQDWPDGAEFRDCARCPEMVVIPDGRFAMGSPIGEWVRDADEGPQRFVALPRFAIGKTEVTFAQWDACVADGYCRAVDYDAGWGRGDRPVINISWADVTGEGVSERGFLAWVNSHVEGAPYRLPSEAEWEYAARAGSSDRWSFGDNVAALVEHAWFSPNAEGRTHPVAGKPANAFGLHDMHGNVWEWVQDCWHPSYDGAPSDGSAWMAENGGDCALSVRRGGAWSSFTAPALRAANREWFARDAKHSYLGFRIARALSE